MAERLEITTWPIALVAVLKLAGWVGGGGEAKTLIAAGMVRVNGETEFRKRRQLQAGDVVSLEDGRAVMLAKTGNRMPD
jgi:ribosome-associated protein